VKYYSSRNLHK